MAADQTIGIHDPASLLECLTQNFQTAFPDYGETDPQNMIQMMGAVCLEARKHFSPRRKALKGNENA